MPKPFFDRCDPGRAQNEQDSRLPNADSTAHRMLRWRNLGRSSQHCGMRNRRMCRQKLGRTQRRGWRTTSGDAHHSKRGSGLKRRKRDLFIYISNIWANLSAFLWKAKGCEKWEINFFFELFHCLFPVPSFHLSSKVSPFHSKHCIDLAQLANKIRTVPVPKRSAKRANTKWMIASWPLTPLCCFRADEYLTGEFAMENHSIFLLRYESHWKWAYGNPTISPHYSLIGEWPYHTWH